MKFWHEIGNESPSPDVSLRLQLRREISKISFKKGLKSPEIRHFGTNASISLASSLDLPPACGLHLLHNCLGNYHISERTGGGGTYLELPQVYCSVSGNIELGKNISDVLLVHLVVADGIQVFDHLLDVNKATVVAVDGIEEFLIINKQTRVNNL